MFGLRSEYYHNPSFTFKIENTTHGTKAVYPESLASLWTLALHTMDICLNTMDTCLNIMDTCLNIMDTCLNIMDTCLNIPSCRALLLDFHGLISLLHTLIEVYFRLGRR